MAGFSNDQSHTELFQEAKSTFIDGQYTIAESLLNQLVLQGFRHAEVFHMLGTIFYDRGQFNKAIRYFKRALEIDPTFTESSIGLSVLLNDLGRYEEGQQVFTEAKELLNQKKSLLDPYVEEKIASKHEEIADLYMQSKKYDLVLENLLKALSLSNRKAELISRVGDCYSKMGQPDKAVKELRSFLRENPGVNSVRLKLSQIFYATQNLADATEQLENILFTDPQNLEAKRLLKMCQAAAITSIEL